MPNKNEEPIKKKIVENYKRGKCDRNGKTYPKHRQGNAGKSDWSIQIDKEKFDENYDKIDWE
jgi:hypothetical protein